MKKKIFLAVGLILLFVFACSDEDVTKASKENPVVVNKIGTLVKAGYFDVTVHGTKISNSINTGNVYSDVKAQEGIQYVTLDVSYKNVDKESRMMTSGDLILKINNQDYTYDKSEIIFADGYGSLETINPFITKRTKIVYKIPAENIEGILYRPSRSKELIDLK
ncbi:MAG: DUF4352 domain-containing protein [Fusobacteriaceae bacterium]